MSPIKMFKKIKDFTASSVYLKIKEYFFTVQHLKIRQLFFQLYRKAFPVTASAKICKKKLIISNDIQKLDFINSNDMEFSNNKICVLGRDVYDFKSNKLLSPDDDYLHEFSFFYFNWLFMQNIAQRNNLILNSESWTKEIFFMHPYVVSKRVLNSVTFLINSENLDTSIQEKVLTRLKDDFLFLKNNIEYHIDANHLLTNYAALTISAKYFGLIEALNYTKIYWKEFWIQCSDLLHYERSPAYTGQLINEAILIYQISDKRLLKKNTLQHLTNILNFLINLLESGLKINFVDNIWEQSPDLEQLRKLRSKLNPNSLTFKKKLPISVAGYLFLHRERFNISLEAGSPSPKHQPGHAHDSTGGIEVSYNDLPLIVNPSISTYENNKIRNIERSRIGHSTLQSIYPVQQTWSAFRVAKRSYPVHALGRFTAGCSFFTKEGRFSRSITLYKKYITIKDSFPGNNYTSLFFIDRGVLLESINKNKIKVNFDNRIFLYIYVLNGKASIQKESWPIRYGKFGCYNIIEVKWQNKFGQIEIRET